MNACSYAHVTFDKGAEKICGENSLFKNIPKKTGYLHAKN
jgi:hypothetical protein